MSLNQEMKAKTLFVFYSIGNLWKESSELKGWSSYSEKKTWGYTPECNESK